MAKFKLLVGSHATCNEPLTLAQEGDIVESESDLVAIHGREKFSLVIEAAPVMAPVPPSDPQAPSEDKKGKK